MPTRSLERPSGEPAPATATLVDGRTIALRPLAEAIARRHLDEHPDERARYGDRVLDWCVHDNQYVLCWAITDARWGGFLEQLAWLARILHARAYPLERLARDLEIAAEEVDAADPDLAAHIGPTLEGGARAVGAWARAGAPPDDDLPRAD